MKWQHKLLFLTFGIVIIGLIAGVWKEKAKIDAAPPSLLTGTLFPSSLPMPAFELQDEQTASFTEADFQNHWTILFFGYTQCPELCPKTLGVMAKTKQLLNPQIPVQMMLVSINPLGDTPEQLKTFFDKPDFKKAHFKGLTGEREEIQKLAGQIGVYVQETMPDFGHIEHSGSLLVINPAGDLTALITNPNDPQMIAQDLHKIMRYRRG